MSNRKSKPVITAPTGVLDAVATKARRRRRAHRNLAEIEDHAPVIRRNDLAPPLRHMMAPIGRLKPASRQVRRRDATQNARLALSIASFGICRPILIGPDFTIIEGHGIWEAAKQLGIEEAPCIVVEHLSASEVRKLSIALNRLAETGAWDIEALSAEFEELTVLEEDLVVTGFEMAEIDTLLLGDVDEVEADVVPDPPAVAISRMGDLWALGEHRLIHGDARDEVAYVQLLGKGETVQFVLTDEPFNVPVGGHVTGGKHREFAMASGEMTSAEFLAFNKEWMTPALTYLAEGGFLATFIDWRSLEIVLAAGRELDLTLFNLIAWVKSNAGQGGLWRSQHEMLPIFKKGDAQHVNNIRMGKSGRWRSNVWTYPGASSLGSDAREGLEQHPTVKPRAMLEDALIDVTNRGDIVLDPFVGSGSMVLAAEATGRLCRAIEYDGRYCDLTISRWQEMTGAEARLVGTGETFAEVKARRDGDGGSEAASDSAPDNDGRDESYEGGRP
jgi:DNA modification methylase